MPLPLSLFLKLVSPPTDDFWDTLPVGHYAGEPGSILEATRVFREFSLFGFEELIRERLLDALSGSLALLLYFAALDVLELFSEPGEVGADILDLMIARSTLRYCYPTPS